MLYDNRTLGCCTYDKDGPMGVFNLMGINIRNLFIKSNKTANLIDK